MSFHLVIPWQVALLQSLPLTSPAGAHFERNRLRSTIRFQRTANSVLTVCLTPGDNPNPNRESRHPSFPMKGRASPKWGATPLRTHLPLGTVVTAATAGTKFAGGTDRASPPPAMARPFESLQELRCLLHPVRRSSRRSEHDLEGEL
jgi:hypothetical protein